MDPGAFTPPDPSAEPAEEAAMPYADDAEEATASPAEAVRRRHEHELASIDGVEGVALTRGATGEDAIVVYLRDASVRDRVPSEIEGIRVETIVTGVIDAYGAPERS